MPKWRVNDWTQVIIGDKRYTHGDTFSASAEEVSEAGADLYVSKVSEPKPEEKPEESVEQQAQPKAANKAVAAPQPRRVKDDD